MKKNMVPATNSFSLLIGMVFYFLIAISLVSCNPSDKDNSKEPLRNWITLDIKFKPNTTAEMRDSTIRSIEKLLLDSFMAPKIPMDSTYSPIITISKSPSTDTFQYFINVGPGSNSPSVQAFPQPGHETTGKPGCNCVNNCGVCKIIQGHIDNPLPGYLEYGNIASVSYPNLDIESKQR